MNIRVITNNVPRDIVDAWETTASERAELDYVDWSAIDRGEDSWSGFRYRGSLYDLGEFMRWSTTPHDVLRSWDGYMSESAFSAIVVRYTDDHESVVVGRVLS